MNDEGNIVQPEFDRTEIFKREIEPLTMKVKELCELHKIPALMSFCITDKLISVIGTAGVRMPANMHLALRALQDPQMAINALRFIEQIQPQNKE